jgi:hypothetical protein
LWNRFSAQSRLRMHHDLATVRPHQLPPPIHTVRARSIPGCLRGASAIPAPR